MSVHKDVSVCTVFMETAKVKNTNSNQRETNGGEEAADGENNRHTHDGEMQYENVGQNRRFVRGKNRASSACRVRLARVL